MISFLYIDLTRQTAKLEVNELTIKFQFASLLHEPDQHFSFKEQKLWKHFPMDILCWCPRMPSL